MKNYIVEFLGAFFLTLAIALVSANPLAVGLMLLALTYIGRHISGAYYNPVLVIAGWRRGALDDDCVLPYIISQIVGSVAALFFVHRAFNLVFIHPMASEVHPIVVLSFELAMAFVFALVFLSLIGQFREGHINGIAIGLTLAALASLGALFNPAVALGSVIIDAITGGGFDKTGAWYLGVFVVAPLVGGFLAAQAYDYFNSK